MKRGLLSPREEEVANLVAEDLMDKEIAMILRISVFTVHEHLSRMGKKLGAATSNKSRRAVIRAWVAERDRVVIFRDATNKAG